MRIEWKKLLICIGFPLAVGGLSALLTSGNMDLYKEINQPTLAPPAWLFPVVWTILYALMGIGAGIVTGKSRLTEADSAINLMIAQLVVNFFWPLIFFNTQAYGFALLWILLLLVLVIWMALEFKKISPFAAYLQIPYIVWLLFATYLNTAVWYLNQ